MDYEEILSKTDCWKLHNSDSKHEDFFAKVPCFCLKIALLFVKEKTGAHFALFYCFFIDFLARTRVRRFLIFAFTSSPMLCKCLIVLL